MCDTYSNKTKIYKPFSIASLFIFNLLNQFCLNCTWYRTAWHKHNVYLILLFIWFNQFEVFFYFSSNFEGKKSNLMSYLFCIWISIQLKDIVIKAPIDFNRRANQNATVLASTSIHVASYNHKVNKLISDFLFLFSTWKIAWSMSVSVFGILLLIEIWNAVVKQL